MNKGSRVVSILNIIFSVITCIGFGYMGYILSIILSIAVKEAETSAEVTRFVLMIVVVILPVIISFVNFVMSCFSLRVLGKGSQKYSKKFHIAMFVAELIAMILYFMYLIVNGAEGVLFLLVTIVAVVYGFFALLHIVDYRKSIKKLSEDEIGKN